MPWTVRLSPSAEKQLSRFPRHHQLTIGKTIERMVVDPFQGNVRSLQGKEWVGRFRRVVGDYRVIFAASHAQQIVEISQILRRSEKTYR